MDNFSGISRWFLKLESFCYSLWLYGEVTLTKKTHNVDEGKHGMLKMVSMRWDVGAPKRGEGGSKILV